MSFKVAIGELYFGCALLLAESYQGKKPEPKVERFEKPIP